MIFDDLVIGFISGAHEQGVEMIMVGGGAVNFHGYQRHSADVDFWIKTSSDNMSKLLKVLNNMSYEIDEFPKEVVEGNQNISVKISPYQELELITNFNPGKTFDEAFKDAETGEIEGYRLAVYKVLSLDDLIMSKAKSKRSKDLLDIMELQRINKNKT
ncbi:MAG: nucleotidyltransferase [Cyclobacteriaceae bacterium]